jgi:hypothetical protein
MDKFLLRVLCLDDTKFYEWAGVYGFTRAPLETISKFRQRVVFSMFDSMFESFESSLYD